MGIEEFMKILHQYIREELIAISERRSNEICIHFNDGTILNVTVTKK